MSYLQLSIGGLSVTLTRFLNRTLPRIDAEGQETSAIYSPSGAASVQGVVYAQKSLWNIEAECSIEAYETLKLIRKESDYQRSSNGDPNILILDTTERYEERGSRTRAIVPSTSEITRSPYVLYYAQFNAIMQNKPEAEETPIGFNVRFVMLETDPTSA